MERLILPRAAPVIPLLAVLAQVGQAIAARAFIEPARRERLPRGLNPSQHARHPRHDLEPVPGHQRAQHVLDRLVRVRVRAWPLVRGVVRQVVRAVHHTLPQQPLRVVRQRLARVLVEAYEAILQPNPLVQPDRHVVVQADVPETVDRHTHFERQSLRDPALLARVGELLGVVAALGAGLEGFFTEARKFLPHQRAVTLEQAAQRRGIPSLLIV